MEENENLLAAARREIDEIDAEMAGLFCRRMDAVRRVAAYKKQHGLPVLDAAREKSVIEKNCVRLPEQDYTEYYKEFILHIMAVSRAFQDALAQQDGTAGT